MIVNVSSVTAVMARPGQALYGLTKAALEHLTRQLASESPPTASAWTPGPAPTTPRLFRASPTTRRGSRGCRGSAPLGRRGYSLG